MMDSSIDSGIVGLNVGGKIYKTSRATLTRYPDSFFSRLLEGSVPSAKDELGNYFIDRDGGIFVHVLNYLRNGELLLPDTFSNFRLLEREADFYLLDELKLALKKPETIGIVDKSSGKTYKICRESLLREQDSCFAKTLNDAETPVLNAPAIRDSHRNFVVASDPSGLGFQQLLQYLELGGIFSDLPDDSSVRYLKEKAEQFGLKVLSDQINFIRQLNLGMYVWLNGPCILYCHSSHSSYEGLAKGICRATKHLKISTSNIVAGLVDVQRIPHDASQVDIELVTSYFLQHFNLPSPFSLKKTDVTSYCTRIEFNGPFGLLVNFWK